MTQTTSRPRTRHDDQLLGLVVAPTIWAIHFLLVYVFAAVWCAKFPGSDLTTPRIFVAAATLLALAGIGLVSLRVVAEWGFSMEEEPRHDDDSQASRHAFLSRATFLLCGLSAVSTVYVALPALFFTSCR